jgi:hypothetical protein
MKIMKVRARIFCILTGQRGFPLARRVTQYSNQTGSVYTSVPPHAVHCMLPKSLFSPALRAAISNAARST